MSQQINTQDWIKKVVCIALLIGLGIGIGWFSRGLMAAQPESTPTVAPSREVEPTAPATPAPTNTHTPKLTDPVTSGTDAPHQDRYLVLEDEYKGYVDGKINEKYNARWNRSDNGYWLHQPYLPESNRKAFVVSVKLDPSDHYRHFFNGVEAQLYLDPECNGDSYLVAERENRVEFEVPDPVGQDHVCARIDGIESFAGGFSIDVEIEE